MKDYRIVRLSNGNFEVQCRGRGILGWLLVGPFWCELYAESDGHSEFSSIGEARAAINRSKSACGGGTVDVVEWH